VAFSLPVVTAGAAWLAVARVCTAWSREEEPPLLRTFASTVRHRFWSGLGLVSAAAAIAALPLLEGRIAIAADLPGARVEVVVLTILAVGGLGVVLLSVPAAAGGLRAVAALRSAVLVVRRAPWAAPAAVAAVAAGALIVYLLPVLAVVMAGPVGFAITAVWVRAGGPRQR
jgi:hypothetical protein